MFPPLYVKDSWFHLLFRWCHYTIGVQLITLFQQQKGRNHGFCIFSENTLFRTLRTEEIKSALTCLGAVTRHFEKGSYIHRAGDKVHTVSLILKGCVNIAYDDIWGNRTILGQAHSGEIFAEAYACMDDEPLLISVEVAEDTEVLMMDMHKILTICPSNCSHHHKLVENLLTILARKNLGLSRRMVYTASKSIRGRVLSYLSFLADKQGKSRFPSPLTVRKWRITSASTVLLSQRN